MAGGKCLEGRMECGVQRSRGSHKGSPHILYPRK